MASAVQSSERAKPAIYESLPPSWLPQISDSVNLGFQGFHPPRPGQDEDLLTEAHVKNGFPSAHVVPAETFTSKTLVVGALTGTDGKDEDPISELGEFMNLILKRREDSLPKIPPSSFRVPQRLTLPESKKQAWFADLANPDIPLHKLGKSVPHGVRGPDLLDALHASIVPVPRAVWFVRVLGCIETTSMKNKPNYDPFQYSVDWANIMNNYLKRQISQIVLPSAPRPGLMIKQSFKGIWSSAELREEWVSKISYSLDLLRVFYVEAMVDHTTFLTWIAQFLYTCNLAQAVFVAHIANGYVKDMLPSRALTKTIIDGCLCKIQEISVSAQKELLLQLNTTLKNILRHIFHELPHAFVCPRIWATHSSLLKPILTLEDVDNDNEPLMKQKAAGLKRCLQTQFCDVEQRNEALLFQFTSEPVQGSLRSAVADVQLLNSITAATNFSDIDFFVSVNDTNDYLFSRKVDLLLSWCASPLQFGSHRPYAAVTLLRLWRSKAEENANVHDFISPQEKLQDELFDWLDVSDLVGKNENADSVSLLFGELVENGLFSYESYLQRLIARGETGLSFAEEPASRHRMILRTVPIYSSSPALVNQRKIALYGIGVRHAPEEATEKELRRQIRSLLPEVFGGTFPNQSVQTELLEQLAGKHSSRYEQVRVVKQWLLPALQKRLVHIEDASGGDTSASVRLFSISTEILKAIKCYRSMLEITMGVLKVASSNEILALVIDTIRCHLDMWACMNKLLDITGTVYAVHQARKTRGEHVRPLVALILDMDDGRYLDAICRQQLIEEVAHYKQALCPIDDNPDPVPTTLPEILLLAQDPNIHAAPALANTLWYKYRTSVKWTWTVWDNVIASLRQVPVIIQLQHDRYQCAFRYSQLLLHVDEHSADGIDVDAMKWLVGLGQNEIINMTAEAWEICIVVFIQLVVNGALKITSLLHGVIYPAWVRAAQVDSAVKWTSAALTLQSANTLFGTLLLQWKETICTEYSHIGLPPTNLSDMQRLRARRGEVYLEANFRRLVEMLPALVLVQNNSFVEQSFRTQAQEVITGICSSSEFCLATQKYFNAVLVTFEKALEPGRFPEEMRDSLMATLHLVFSNDSQGYREDSAEVDSSILSPWKLSATCALTKFDLRQIATRMESQATTVQAEAELTQLVDRLLHSNISAEEAEFIIEMTKGVNKIVAGKFLNCGLRRLSQIMEEVQTADVDTLQSMTERADHFLTLLSTIAIPTRGELTAHSARLNADVQNGFMPKLLAKLTLMESSLLKYAEETEPSFGRRPPVTSSLLFVVRLVQYNLGFEGAWTAQTRDVGNQILAALVRLAALYGGGIVTDSVAFSMLMDTAFYIFDELPLDMRQNVASDIYQHCPSLDTASLPLYMPPAYKELIISLFRHSIHSKSTVCPVDGIPPALSRPWEWLEYLGDQPSDPKDHDEKKQLHAKYIVRNNTSLSLELFDAQLTSECVRHSQRDGDAPTWIFEDGLAAESIYERAWRNGHVGGARDRDGVLTRRGERENSTARASVGTERRGTPARSSPAPSAKSSIGGVTSGNSSRQSPFGRDPMDVDNLYPPVVRGKRKASAAGIGEDDDHSSMHVAGSLHSSSEKGKGKALGRARGK